MSATKLDKDLLNLL
jgi:ribosomal protein S1